jgi:WD40 repeat protein
MSSSQTIFIPFPGLRSFTVNESNIFFGREEQINELLERLHDSQLLAVIGTSGSGKSSLIRAGLISYLHAGFMGQDKMSWHIIEFRPTKCLITNLVASLSQAFTLDSDSIIPPEYAESLLRQGSNGLYRIISLLRTSIGQPPIIKETECVLILIDQFEEIFRLRQEAFNDDELLNDLSKFIDLLLNVVKHPEIKTYVIITMRSDFLESCSQFPNLPEAISRNAYLVPQMNREQIQNAIREPIRKLISGSLVSTLIKNIANSPDQLPVLQHALRRTWQNWYASSPRSVEISEEHYQKIGGIKHALSNHADEIYTGLNDEHGQKIAELLFKRITGKSQDGQIIRCPVSFQEILSIVQATDSTITRQELLTVIEAFRHLDCCFITPPIEMGEIRDDVDIDISHESLMRLWGRLRTWIDEEAEKVQDYLELAKRFKAYQDERGDLLSGRALAVALQWRDKYHPNEAWAARCSSRFGTAIDFAAVINFLDRSKTEEEARAEEAERQRQRREEQRDETIRLQRATIRTRNQIIWGSIGFCVLLVISIIALFLQFKEAKNAQLIALSSSSEANFSANRQLEALIDSLKAGEQLRQPNLVDSQTYLRVISALRQGVYNTRELNRLNGHLDIVQSIVYSPNFIVSASIDGKIIIWKHNGEIIRKIDNESSVNSIALSPDEKMLVAGGNDSTIKIWHVGSGKQEAKISLKKGDSVTSIDFNHNGDTFVSSAGTSITFWGVKGNSKGVLPKSHKKQINCVKFNPDGDMIASASDDHTVRLWKLRGGKNTSFKEIGSQKYQDQVADLVFSPDGKTLASAVKNQIEIWNLISKRSDPLNSDSPKSTVFRVRFSPDGQRIASAHQDGSVIIWDVVRKSEIVDLKGHSETVRDVEFSPDGQRLISAGQDKIIKLWSSTVSSELAEVFGNQKGFIYQINFNRDGKMLASANKDKTVSLWKIENGKARFFKSLKHYDSVSSVTFSSDGRYIASASIDGAINLWASEGEFVRNWNAHNKDRVWLGFSPDSKILVSASSDRKVKLWNTEGKIVREFSQDGSPIIGLDVSSIETAIVSAHKDGTIKIRNYQGELKFSPVHVQGEIHSVSFGSDGRVIASVDSSVKIWSTNGALMDFSKLIQDNEDILYANFSPDKQIMVSAAGRNVHLWDQRGNRLNILYGGNDTIRSTAFSRDGSLLAAASRDGSITLWHLSLDDLIVRGCNKIQDYLITLKKTSKEKSICGN